MKVFILSLLAVSSVHSTAIRYPYHEQLLSYTPARGEFPVYNNLAQDYVIYYDSNGAKRALSYNFPEPLYGVQRYGYSYGNSANQLLRTRGLPESGFSAASYYQLEDTNELTKAREENFRRYCEQRYQALKSEIDRISASGLKPSDDMMAQIKPLEKIISSTSFTAITETPEIKSLREEHLRLWNAARLRVLMQEAEHLRHQHGNKADIDAGQNLNTVAGETAEQKKAREEHLRIYNEQLRKVQQAQAATATASASSSSSAASHHVQHYGQLSNLDLKSGFAQAQHTSEAHQQPLPISDTPEVIRAREEHLRLFNEAKIRAQAQGSLDIKDDGSYKGNYEQQNLLATEQLKPYGGLKVASDLHRIPLLSQNVGSFQTTQQIQQVTLQHQQQQQINELKSSLNAQQETSPVQDTPEVMKAREEHLRLFNEAKIRAQAQGTLDIKDDGSYKGSHEATEDVKNYGDLKGATEFQQPALLPQVTLQQQQQSSLLKSSASEQLEPLPLQDTPEVLKAREEHLKIFNEVKSKTIQQEAQQINRLDAGLALQGTERAEILTASTDESEKLREAQRLREEKLQMEAELLREAERIREEEKMRELERLRDIERQREDEKMLEAERLRLKAEEDTRLEMERLAEAKRFEDAKRIEELKRQELKTGSSSGLSSDLIGSQLKTQTSQAAQASQQNAQIFQSGQILSTQSLKSGALSSSNSNLDGVSSGLGSGFVLSSQFKNNPYLLRLAAQPGTTAYVIGDQQTATQAEIKSPHLYYLPAGTQIKQAAPSYLRFTQSGLKYQDGAQQAATHTTLGAGQALKSDFQQSPTHTALGGGQAFQQNIGNSGKFAAHSSQSSFSSSSSSSDSKTSSNLQLNYGAESNTAGGLSELEKATREHFRAHEIALERLRLANLHEGHDRRLPDCA